jgi:hypothetical protein
MKHALEIAGYTLLIILMAGTAGYHLSERQKGPRCPTVQGAKVAVTVDSADEQRCMYIQDLSPGEKRLSVRL